MSAEILAFLAARWPQASVRMTDFPSGSRSIEVRLGGEMVVVDCRPGHGYGVSLVSDSDLPFSAHDQAFASPAAAIRYLGEVLNVVASSRT